MGSTTDVDYSLYLVTDSTPAILGKRDLVKVVEAALKGGVTIVQYRDKISDTGDLISTARRIHAVTQKFNVPLLINDRIDVALAVGCEGVHIGQDDIGVAINNFHGETFLIKQRRFDICSPSAWRFCDNWRDSKLN